MSYCRFTEGDVYVFMDVGGYLNCCGCCLQDRSFHASSTQDMLDHLIKHVEQGHDVPTEVFGELALDDSTNFPKTGAADAD